MAKKEKGPAPAEEPKGEGQAAEAAAPKKGLPLKLILIVVLAMVVGGVGAFAAMKFLGGSTPPPAAESEAAAPPPAPAADSGGGEAPIKAPERKGGGETTGGHGGAEGEAAAPEAAGPLNIEFKPFIVNLNDSGGKRFLKLTMSVEAEGQALADEINAKMPQFRDIILLLLSSMSYDDISTLDGKMRLRQQMLNRLNTQLSAGKVKNIYFSEFVVQ